MCKPCKPVCIQFSIHKQKLFTMYLHNFTACSTVAAKKMLPFPRFPDLAGTNMKSAFDHNKST